MSIKKNTSNGFTMIEIVMVIVIAGIIAAIAHGLGIFVYATVTVITLEFILQYNETIFFIIQILKIKKLVQ